MRQLGRIGTASGLVLALVASVLTLSVTGSRPVEAATQPPPAARQVALTFDDGPGPATGAVLDVLDRYGVDATFFVIGTVIGGREATLERMAAAGHSVQNHTWGHPALTQLSNDGIRSQLSRTSDRIQQVVGVRPTCFRPPGRKTDARVESVAAGIGLRQVLWTDDPSDWQRLPASTIVSRVLAGANGSGRIVLLHDGGSSRAGTLAALPAIIEGFRARGYQFVTLCNPAPPPPPPEVVDCLGRELPPEVALPAPAGSRFEPLPPQRVLDTRTGTGTVPGLVGAGCGVAVTVTGPGGAPPGAGAVALSIVATEPRRAGFVTAWPCGAPRPLASVLNPAPGVDVAGSAVVPVGDGGRVCLSSSTGTHLVVDVTGWFGPSATGGFAPVDPVRLADSRTGPFTVGLRRVEPGEVVPVPVAGQGGVPAGATAAALTVTATDAERAGFLRVFPCGQAVPATSSLNLAPGADRAVLVLTGLGDGRACLQANVRMHVVVDATGWFGPAAAGTFHPAVPVRRLDTRDGTGGVPPLAPGAVRVVPVSGTVGVPADAGAVLWTLTAVDAGTRGWLAARPCATVASTSTVNPQPGGAVAAAAITPLDTSGSTCLEANVPTQVVADVAGWFSTEPPA